MIAEEEQRLALVRHVACKESGELASALLSALPPSARAIVHQLLEDSRSEVRLWASRWLVAHRIDSDTELLLRVLRQDRAPEVRFAIIVALRAVADARVAPALIKAPRVLGWEMCAPSMP